MSNAVSAIQTHQDAPQAQISQSAMADVTQLIKSLETPYLRDIQKLLAVEIESRAKNDRTEAIFKIQRIAAEMGVTVEQLMASALPRKNANAGRKYGPAKIKYRHPEQPDLTWTGRGHAPIWITEWENSGGSVADLLVDKD